MEQQKELRKEGYYWCKLPNCKWDIFYFYTDGNKWYDGYENPYKDYDFEEIDERQIVRNE